MICDLRLNSSIPEYWPISAVNTASHRRFISTPRWAMSIFLLKSDDGTPQNMRFNVFVTRVCSIYGENNIWHPKSWRFTLAVEVVSQTALFHMHTYIHCVLSPVTGVSLWTCTVGFCGVFSLLMAVFFYCYFFFFYCYFILFYFTFFLVGLVTLPHVSRFIVTCIFSAALLRVSVFSLKISSLDILDVRREFGFAYLG